MNHLTGIKSVYPVTDFNSIKDQMLNWAQQFNIFCLLDNHNYQIRPNTFECLLAVDVVDYINASDDHAIHKLQQFLNNKRSWLFGHLGYDLKNEIEDLFSHHSDRIKFPDLFFFEPGVVIRLNEKEISIESRSDPQKIYESISNTKKFIEQPVTKEIQIQHRINKSEYLNIIHQLKNHILRGDCYEINFCQEFFAENISIDPLTIFKKLSAISPNPFSALYKLDDKYLICASPERFLYKNGSKIISQPIKGTSKRILADEAEDKINRTGLFNSEKDRSENVMVVDLVRNDLSKVCEEGSVEVEELYGIYSFPQVHQMISTVSGTLKKDSSFEEIIRATFPMGSMTGAPKKRVMQLIEEYEKTKRGIFSGALGYITKDGDFDFNVIIRSILYNATEKCLSFPAGSGITYYSDAELEWDECMLKAEAIRSVLEKL